MIRDAAGPMLWGTIKGTIPLTIISFAVGLQLALATALARRSGSRWLDLPARFYISVIRGTPLLVQLFIVFYGFPQIGIMLPGFTAACLALSLNWGGRRRDHPRLDPVGAARPARGRHHHRHGALAGDAAHRSPAGVADRRAAAVNTLLSLVKDRSLVSVVLVTDLFREAQNAAAVSFEYLPLYSLAALYYWVICFVLSQGQNRLEKKLGRYAV